MSAKNKKKLQKITKNYKKSEKIQKKLKKGLAKSKKAIYNKVLFDEKGFDTRRVRRIIPLRRFMLHKIKKRGEQVLEWINNFLKTRFTSKRALILLRIFYIFLTLLLIFSFIYLMIYSGNNSGADALKSVRG